MLLILESLLLDDDAPAPRPRKPKTGGIEMLPGHLWNDPPDFLVEAMAKEGEQYQGRLVRRARRVTGQANLSSMLRRRRAAETKAKHEQEQVAKQMAAILDEIRARARAACAPAPSPMRGASVSSGAGAAIAIGGGIALLLGALFAQR